jgi:hypothetical protein
VPLVESVAVARAAGQARPSAALLEQRLAGLERDMAALTVSVARITVASAAVEPGARSPRLVAGGSSTTAGVTGGHPAH